jgi:hypothetical protein
MLYVGQDRIAARSAMKDSYLGPGIMELPNHVRADETRATDHQSLHLPRPPIDGSRA